MLGCSLRMPGYDSRIFLFSDNNLKAIIGLFGAGSDAIYELRDMSLAWYLQIHCHLLRKEPSLLFVLVPLDNKIRS